MSASVPTKSSASGGADQFITEGEPDQFITEMAFLVTLIEYAQARGWLCAILETSRLQPAAVLQR